MKRASDELWTDMKETYGRRKEWRNYFGDDNNKRKISKTLTNEETWRSGDNFLLRFNDKDDEDNTPRPWVQLAVNFVEHMAWNHVFTRFLKETFREQSRRSQSTETAEPEENRQRRAAVSTPAASETQEMTAAVETEHVIELQEMSRQNVEREPLVAQPENERSSTVVDVPADGETVSLVGNGDPQNDSRIDLCRRRNLIIHEAAKTGRCAVLKEFLRKGNVNSKNSIGETALHLAAEFEHPDDVKILLDEGATTFMVCVVICNIAVLMLELEHC